MASGAKLASATVALAEVAPPPRNPSAKSASDGAGRRVQRRRSEGDVGKVPSAAASAAAAAREAAQAAGIGAALPQQRRRRASAAAAAESDGFSAQRLRRLLPEAGQIFEELLDAQGGPGRDREEHSGVDSSEAASHLGSSSDEGEQDATTQPEAESCRYSAEEEGGAQTDLRGAEAAEGVAGSSVNGTVCSIDSGMVRAALAQELAGEDGSLAPCSSHPQLEEAVGEDPTLASPPCSPGIVGAVPQYAAAQAMQPEPDHPAAAPTPRMARLSLAFADSSLAHVRSSEQGSGSTSPQHRGSLELSAFSDSAPSDASPCDGHANAHHAHASSPRQRDGHTTPEMSLSCLASQPPLPTGEPGRTPGATPQTPQTPPVASEAWAQARRPPACSEQLRAPMMDLRLAVQVARRAAYEEVQAEVQQILRDSAPMQQLERHLRAELFKATDLAQTLGIAVEIGETRLRAAMVDQHGALGDPAPDAALPLGTAGHRDCRPVREDHGPPLPDSRGAEGDSRPACGDSLPLDGVEKVMKNADSVADAAVEASLRQAVRCLLEERHSMEEALSVLKEQGTELRQECSRLRSEQAQATSQMQAREFLLQAAKARLLRLASARGPPHPEASIDELVRRIESDRTEAQRIVKQRQSQGEWLDARLAQARREAAQLANERRSLEHQLLSARQQLHTCCDTASMQHKELGLAQAEQRQLRAGQAEAGKMRIQMVNLIEELRADTRSDHASRCEISRRLGALQRTVEQATRDSSQRRTPSMPLGPSQAQEGQAVLQQTAQVLTKVGHVPSAPQGSLQEHREGSSDVREEFVNVWDTNSSSSASSLRGF